MLVYNTKTRTKEEFIPQRSGEVRAYICGPTVYDYCHIGHARTYINFDVLRRYLEATGYDFIHVQNFTDVDDKITKRAAERGMTPIQLSDEFIEEYFRDMDALNVKRASRYTRASDYIGKIVEITERLMAKGIAYRSGGTVYFDVEGAGGFGELVSGIEGAVTDPIMSLGKRGPFDFVLWREGGAAEQSWDSRIGRGRPGWHTECVAMAMDSLGEVLDIHWGGMDLIYPHHECSALVARAITGKPFARYWMHNNFVTLSGEKMSKSAGNTAYIRDVLEGFRAEVLRTYLLSKGYRERIDYSEAGMERMEKTYDLMVEGAAEARKGGGGAGVSSCIKEYADAFFGALDDDLETGQALAVVERLSWEITGGAPDKDFAGASRIYDAVEGVLGIRLRR